MNKKPGRRAEGRSWILFCCSCVIVGWVLTLLDPKQTTARPVWVWDWDSALRPSGDRWRGGWVLNSDWSESHSNVAVMSSGKQQRHHFSIGLHSSTVFGSASSNPDKMIETQIFRLMSSALTRCVMKANATQWNHFQTGSLFHQFKL